MKTSEIQDQEQTTQPIIEFRNIDKWYSGVKALKSINIKIYPGEIIGLVGDNGAGKSTLMNILSGVHQQDKGEVYIDGQLARFKSPRSAQAMGIETIYQYNSSVNSMNVARNIFLGREPLKFKLGHFGWIDQKKMLSETVTAMKNLEFEIRSPEALVGELSGGQRQGVAIARAMYFKSKVVILDEPTNHISVKETNKVLKFVKSLKDQNMTGIFVSHNLHHVLECCTRIVVMAKGQVIRDTPNNQIQIDDIMSLI